MTKVLLFGYLRRDVMLLGVVDEGASAEDECRKAVEQGRAQQAWTIEVSAFASASDVNWANPDQHHVSGASPAASVPPLNPATSGDDDARHDEQETTDESDALPETTIRQNIADEAEAAPKGPNTGANPDGTPTDQADLGKVPADKKAK